MAGICASRSALRSSPLRTAAAAASYRAVARSSLRLFLREKSPVARFLRFPIEASCCVELLFPMHSAVASAAMTSALAASRRGYCWMSEGS